MFHCSNCVDLDEGDYLVGDVDLLNQSTFSIAKFQLSVFLLLQNLRHL
jgi:hypothetical protein